MTKWIKWADGISVTEEDHKALSRDLALFGNVLVETIGNLRGRRIAPESFYMRKAAAELKSDR